MLARGCGRRDGAGVIRDLLAIRRPLAGFASIGVMWGAFAAQVPVIKGRVGAGDAEWGTVLSLSALGLLTALALAARLERRTGAAALPLAAVAMAAAFLIPAAAGGLWVAAGGLFLVAVGSGVTDVLANARLSEVEAREGRSLRTSGTPGSPSPTRRPRSRRASRGRPGWGPWRCSRPSRRSSRRWPSARARRWRRRGRTRA